MLEQLAEAAPKLPEPKLPKLPNLDGLDTLLAKLKLVTDGLDAQISQINTGLLITGMWIGLVSMAVIWFVCTRIKK